MCACIVHDVCIYIPAHPFQCDCHSLCHLRQAVPNFHYESKVTRHRIFIVEIWYYARMPKESIDWYHARSKAKPQRLHTCKALKASAEIMFLLPISEN